MGERCAVQRVLLPAAGFEVSRLGFGTAALMSRVNRRDSVRLLQTALECGITHLDTARSYGFGEAEMAVGDVLSVQRDRFTVTTKVGILPPRRSAGLGAVKAVARGVLSVLPGLRAAIRSGAGTLVEGGRFDEDAMEQSLHTSLRQLRTDYVDFLLLHEPSSGVLATPAPLAFLERVQREGKVRAFGIAATEPVVMYASQGAPGYAKVLQLANSVFQPAPDELLTQGDHAVFTHSALGPWLRELKHDLEKRPETAARWSSELQTDLKDPGVLEALALQCGLARVPQGCVLFASTQPAHIRENAAVFGAAASEDQLHRFAQLAGEWKLRRSASFH